MAQRRSWLMRLVGHMSQAEAAEPAGESDTGGGCAEPEAERQPGQEAGTVEARAEEAANAAGAKPVEGAADSVSEEVPNHQASSSHQHLTTNTSHRSSNSKQ